MFNKDVSAKILEEFQFISHEFSSFQVTTNLSCPEGCGQCCFKNDVSCSPIELLPMAINLLEIGEAEKMYDLALAKKGNKCIFLDVHSEEKGMGKCLEYKYRPLVCRSFGVAARKDKNDAAQYSVCKKLKENKGYEYQNLLEGKFSNESAIPYIDVLRNRLFAIHPAFLEEERPINEALSMILEKVMMASFYANDAGARTTASPETRNFPSSP